MKAMYLIHAAQGPTLVEGNVPQPLPGPGELLIRVYAAGVTVAELQWYPTLHTKTGERRVGAVPSHEFSGIVADKGSAVGSFRIGQAVFGMSDWFVDGAMAEYCIARCSTVAPKPPALTHVAAASIPISGLTAWQGLFDHAKLQAGERVLVHGGAGAVGIFAVQLAKMRGAHVIATAAARNLDFVKSLGADQVIDYEASRFEESTGRVDVVFDTVGGDTLERSWSLLNPGRMVTVASTAADSTEARVKEAFFIVEPNSQQLTMIGDLVQAGYLQTVVDAVIPLSKACRLYTPGPSRHGRGKLVVQVAAPADHVAFASDNLPTPLNRMAAAL